MNQKKKSIFALTALAVCLTAGVASATGVLSSGTVPSPKPPAASPAAELSRHFAVLGDTELGGLPKAAKSQLAASGVVKAVGGNVDLAKSVPTSTGGDAVVIPGSNGICLYIPDPVDGYGGGCSSIDAAIRNGLAVTLGIGDGAIVAALAPDGTGAVSTTDAAGDTTSLPVRHNLASTEIDSPKSVNIGGAETGF